MTNHPRKEFHMCTICHALTPSNNSGPHYAWHAEMAWLLKAVHDATNPDDDAANFTEAFTDGAS